MKLSRILTTLVTALLLAVVTQTAIAGEQDFQLYNRTGVDIYAIYISPSGEESWEEDIMGQDIMLNGADITIRFDRAEDAQYWDIRIEDSEGNFLYWEEIDLLSAYEVILNEDGTARIKD
jgi:hypothetical protein